MLFFVQDTSSPGNGIHSHEVSQLFHLKKSIDSYSFVLSLRAIACLSRTLVSTLNKSVIFYQGQW